MRKKIILFIVVTFFVGLFFYRHSLVATLLELAIREIEYENRAWEEGKLVYRNLKIGTDFTAKEARVDFQIETSPFYVQAHVFLQEPHIVGSLGEETNPLLATLVPQRFWGIKLDAEDGMLKLQKEETSFFTWSFQSGEEKEKIGKLFVYDEEGEVGCCSFEKIQTGLAVQLQGRLLHLNLLAKGVIHEDATFWMEGEGKLGDATLLFSLCRPAFSSYVLQTEFSNWGNDSKFLISHFLPDVEIPENLGGLFSGKCTAWIDEGNLKRLVWEEVEGKDFYFEWAAKNVQAFAAYLNTNGQWEENSLKSFDLTVKNSTMRKDEWYVEEVEGNVHFIDTLFQECSAKGVFLDKPIALTWAGPLPEISGKIYREEDSLDFGLTSFEKGWFHGNTLASKHFPFLQGDLQIAGNFSTEKIEGHLRSEGIEFEHPLFEGKIFLSEKGAPFSYEFSSKEWEIALPLQKSNLREKEHNLFFEDIEGVLSLKPQKGHIEKFSASCAGASLQGQLDFFVVGEDVLNLKLTNLQGEIAGYNFSCNELKFMDKGRIELDLLVQKGGPLARVENLVAFVKDDIFEFQGKGVFWGEKPLHPVQGKGKKLQKGWQIDKVQIGDFFAKGFLSDDKGKGEIRWKEYAMQGEATLDKGNIALQISSLQGFPYKGKGQALVSLFPQPKIQNLSLSFEDVVRLSTDSVAYHESTKKWQAEEVDVQVNKGDIPFKGVMAVKLAPAFLSFQGVVQQGSISSLRIKQLMGLYEAPFLNIKFQTVYQDQPFHMTLRVNSDRDYAGDLFIQEPQTEEGLSLILGPNKRCERVDGHLRGIEAHLKKESASFVGSIKIIDGQRASLFLDSLKWVKGIDLTGRWKKEEEGFSFQGEMKGKDFEISTKRFKELDAFVEIHPQTVSVKNLSIFDDKFSLFAKQIECQKSLGNWMVDVPLIKGQNICPNKEKPFLIRHLVLADMRGILGDRSTFRGRGSFNFTNAFKREGNIFQIPVEMIKNLGLDINLLTPVSGEVEYQLKGSKIYLTSLKNTFSEGRRSQFYLPRDASPSTIDLDGNLDLSLRLKQDVVLKWAEPFTISIGGSIESPQYSLK
jgi:hypothetical protein